MSGNEIILGAILLGVIILFWETRTKDTIKEVKVDEFGAVVFQVLIPEETFWNLTVNAQNKFWTPITPIRFKTGKFLIRIYEEKR